MCYVDRIQNSCCVIRVNVADEFCFHFEAAVFLCPVFQSQIHRTRAKVASADTDLHNGGEFFTCCVGDLTCMYFVRELCDAVLLLYVESGDEMYYNPFRYPLSMTCIGYYEKMKRFVGQTFLSLAKAVETEDGQVITPAEGAEYRCVDIGFPTGITSRYNFHQIRTFAIH